MIKVLFAVSEAAPFIKTGGLGDVAGSLPAALADKCDIRVVMPLYSGIEGRWRSEMKFIGQTNVSLSWRNQYCGVFSLRKDGVTWYFIDNEYYFKRADIYGGYDDAERFAFFSKAVIDILPMIDFKPDVIHANDWQTAMIPVYMKMLYGYNPEISGIKTVYTIHNIQYQGQYSAGILEDVFGIDASAGYSGPLEMNGCVNLMKAAVCLSDRVTTVSPTYANEIQYPEHSYGLDSILWSNRDKLTGILNGIDEKLYDPSSDTHLFKNYSAKAPEGKADNRAGLLQLLGLEPAGPNTAVIGIVSRLVSHKGIDIVGDALDQIMSRDVRLIVLGTGEWRYEQMFINASKRFPGKLSANIMFSADLASKIYAGCDMFLMPSHSEPCGLSQIIAMRYGTAPIVRSTGGLADTVSCFDPESGSGNGFPFGEYSAYGMLGAIDFALHCFSDKKLWAKVVKNGMTGDFSWTRSAAEYLGLYESLT